METSRVAEANKARKKKGRILQNEKDGEPERGEKNVDLSATGR